MELGPDGIGVEFVSERAEKFLADSITFFIRHSCVTLLTSPRLSL
jgi:hypothetical protein